MEMTYCFGNATDRAEYAAECTLERCGVEYEMRMTEELVGTSTTLYFLHLTRVSPTLKQMLTPGFRAQ